jgi:hypothetical protein
MKGLSVKSALMIGATFSGVISSVALAQEADEGGLTGLCQRDGRHPRPPLISRHEQGPLPLPVLPFVA